jgi:hypothetical protein
MQHRTDIDFILRQPPPLTGTKDSYSYADR